MGDLSDRSAGAPRTRANTAPSRCMIVCAAQDQIGMHIPELKRKMTVAQRCSSEKIQQKQEPMQNVIDTTVGEERSVISGTGVYWCIGISTYQHRWSGSSRRGDIRDAHESRRNRRGPKRCCIVQWFVTARGQAKDPVEE
jgi:hypothetical protein